jgi:hypothetical protein
MKNENQKPKILNRENNNFLAEPLENQYPTHKYIMPDWRRRRLCAGPLA